MSAKILVVDNYDSFVYTIVGYLRLLGATCDVIRNDSADPLDITTPDSPYDGVLISPGPGTPAGAGRSLDFIHACFEYDVPMLGVCLGHQGLAEAFGGDVVNAPVLMHGKTSLIHHTNEGIFHGLPSPYTATRYHSLTVLPESVPDCLAVTAWTEDNTIMGLAHKTAPLFGVQFHPESVISEHGHRLFANWLQRCGDNNAVQHSEGLTPLVGKNTSA